MAQCQSHLTVKLIYLSIPSIAQIENGTHWGKHNCVKFPLIYLYTYVYSMLAQRHYTESYCKETYWKSNIYLPEIAPSNQHFHMKGLCLFRWSSVKTLRRFHKKRKNVLCATPCCERLWFITSSPQSHNAAQGEKHQQQKQQQQQQQKPLSSSTSNNGKDLELVFHTRTIRARRCYLFRTSLEEHLGDWSAEVYLPKALHL